MDGHDKFIFCFQGCDSGPFFSMYSKHGIQVQAKEPEQWRALVNCAMMEFTDVLSSIFHSYLATLGFKSSAMLAKHMETCDDKVFSMQILLLAMLNRTHIRVMTPQGDMHTHDFVPGDY